MVIKIRRHCGSVRESVERCHGQTGDRTGLWPVMVEEDRLMWPCISPAMPEVMVEEERLMWQRISPAIRVRGSGPARWVLRRMCQFVS